MKRDLKPEMNKKYNTIALYTLAVALIIVGCILAVVYYVPLLEFFKKIFQICSPLLYGFVFAYVLCPVCNFFDTLCAKLQGNKKIHRYFLNTVAQKGGIILTYLFFLTALAGVFYIIIPQITDSFNNFYSNYQIYIARADRILGNIAVNTNLIPAETAATIEKALIDFIKSFVERIFEFSPILINTLSGFAVEIWNIVLGIIISIYMLFERKSFIRRGKKLLYAYLHENTAETVCAGFKKTHEIFGRFVNGKILDSIIIGILCFIGTTILNIPYAPLVSLIVGLTNVIPYFGPFLGAIPSAVIVFLNSPVKCLWFILFVFLLQQLDGNVIGPKILGQSIGVSSFWIITSLLIMGGLYGVIGMVIAVPLYAIINYVLTKSCNKILNKKGLCINDKGVFRVDIDKTCLDNENFDGEYKIQNEK